MNYNECRANPILLRKSGYKTSLSYYNSRPKQTFWSLTKWEHENGYKQYRLKTFGDCHYIGVF